MAIKKILVWPHNRLHDKSSAVDLSFVGTPEYDELVKDLTDTLKHYRGVGLSAIQIGVDKRIFVMNVGDKGDVGVFINPVIMSTDGVLTPMQEGCLSIPGVFEMVPRYPQVVVSALDPTSHTEKLWDLEGVEAQCAQHEIEHFEGKLLVDRLGNAKRTIAKRTVHKVTTYDPTYANA